MFRFEEFMDCFEPGAVSAGPTPAEASHSRRSPIVCMTPNEKPTPDDLSELGAVKVEVLRLRGLGV